MKNLVKTALLAGALAVLGLVEPASAQSQTRVAAEKDWSIFESGSGAGKVCWIVSTPIKTNATRGGQAVQVRRGDIFLMVSMRPADKVVNEVSYLGGYPFDKGSKVDVTIDNKSFTMFTDGENAWMSSPKEDNDVVSAFKSGKTVVLKGKSGKGTATADTFSLSGFSAAITKAAARCK